jgi:hypothetical protein
MREILFRGKSVNDSRWVFGNLSDYGDCKTITTVKDFSIIDSCEVIPETVGQYTGLKDKNGTKIFEGDVVNYIEIDFDGPDIKGKGGLRWNDNTASFEIFNGLFGVNFCQTCQTLFFQIEVIGNIHDNPELMGGNTYG